MEPSEERSEVRSFPQGYLGAHRGLGRKQLEIYSQVPEAMEGAVVSSQRGVTFVHVRDGGITERPL